MEGGHMRLKFFDPLQDLVNTFLGAIFIEKIFLEKFEKDMPSPRLWKMYFVTLLNFRELTPLDALTIPCVMCLWLNVSNINLVNFHRKFVYKVDYISVFRTVNKRGDVTWPNLTWWTPHTKSLCILWSRVTFWSENLSGLKNQGKGYFSLISILWDLIRATRASRRMIWRNIIIFVSFENLFIKNKYKVGTLGKIF